MSIQPKKPGTQRKKKVQKKAPSPIKDESVPDASATMGPPSPHEAQETHESATDLRLPHQRMLDAIKGGSPTRKVAILIGDPDPDSMGSGFGMKLLIETLLECDCDIIFEGEVDDPQNKTMVNVLNINMKPLSEFGETPLSEIYNRFIFVDHVPRSKMELDLAATVVIDHHRADFTNAVFCDVDRQVGSCCSLVLQYMRDLGVTLDGPDDEGVFSKVATSMLFGVNTDTTDLMSENTTEMDEEAVSYLRKRADRALVKDIVNYVKPDYFFETRSRLDNPENQMVEGSFFIGTVGELSQGRKWCLWQLAVDRLGMEGVTTSVIFAFINDRVVASIRSKNPSFEVNSQCQLIFGKQFAGGKHGAGGASVPLGVLGIGLLDGDIKAEALAIYKKLIMERIQRVCGSH
jgi:nanoRNase/pAp phosphatase (c-di-AMP/oligoRNAs hydrolase)